MSAAKTAMTTILVADDEPSIRTLLEVILSSDGHDVVAVADGKEALAYLKDHTPDLAILDVNMPHLSGIDVCIRMRGVSRLRNVPVVVLTALSDDGTRTAAEFARADLVINKPLSGKNLRQTVAGLLRSAAEGAGDDGGRPVA